MFRVTTFGWVKAEWHKDRTHFYETRKAFVLWSEYHKKWGQTMFQKYGRKAKVTAEEYIDGQGWTVIDDWSC